MNKFKELRLKAGIGTAKEAAKLLNISESHLYQIEEGGRKPGNILALRMAKLYGCKIQDLKGE